MKKCIKQGCSWFLIFVMVLQMLPVVPTYADELEVVVDVKSYVLRNELNTNHESTLYTGELVVTNYTDMPSDGNQYLILEVNIEVPNSKSGFSMSELKVSKEKKTYPLIETGFLKNHYYNPITATQLSSGFVSGHIVFEVPGDLEIDGLSLIYGEKDIDLAAVSDSSANANSVVKNTNFTTISGEEIDYEAQQKEVDARIQVALDSGNYTFDNPYVVQDPYGRSPLTALVCFVTEEETEISVSVAPKSEYGAVEYTVPTKTKTHLVPIAGLYADYNNKVTLSAKFSGKIQTKVLEIQTGLIDFNRIEYSVEELNISVHDEHFTGVSFVTGHHYQIVDVNADIRWICTLETSMSFENLENGHIMLHQNISSGFGNEGKNQVSRFIEIDILGKIHTIYDVNDRMHHDFELVDDNKLAYTGHNIYGTGIEDTIIVLDLVTGDVVEVLDLNEVLDRHHIKTGYRGYDEDWFHANALDYDKATDSYIVSGVQYGIVKLNSSREVEWVLAAWYEWDEDTLPYLLTPVDDYGEELFDMSTPEGITESHSFFPWGQHAIEFLPDLDENEDTLEVILFNNNVYTHQYSEGVVYSIHEEKKTVRILRKYGEELTDLFYSGSVSDANLLANNNMLIASGDTLKNDRTIGQIIEVNEKNEIQFHFHLMTSKIGERIWNAESVELFQNSFQVELHSDIKTFKIDPEQTLEVIPNVENFMKVDAFQDSGNCVLYEDSDVVYVTESFTDFTFDRQLGYIEIFNENGDSVFYGFTLELNNSADYVIHLQNDFHDSYRIFIVDERAETIYQYPIKNFVSRQLLVDNEELINPKSISSVIDVGTISLEKNQLALNGWAVIKELDTDENTSIHLIFSGTNSYSIPLELFVREGVTAHFNDGFNYNYSGFKQTIPLSSLPSDYYTIGIEVKNQGEVGYVQTEYFIEIDHGDADEPITNLDFLSHQNLMTEAMLADYNGGSYSLEAPFTKVDPYGISPLSAIALFETDKPAKISVSVAGLNGGDTISHSYSDFKSSHQIPIHGLYPNKETNVTLTATYEDGSTESKTIPLTGKSLPEDLLISNVKTAEVGAMAEVLTFYSGQEQSSYFHALDSKGDVRFTYSLNGLGVISSINHLSNGNLMVISEKASKNGATYKESFYEMDLTGRIYLEYLHDGVHHEMQEANNGNILIIGNDKGGYVQDDTVYELDRTTGTILKMWDMDDVFPLEAYNEAGNRVTGEFYNYTDKDWIHVNSIDQHPQTNELLFSGRRYDVVYTVDYATSEVNWILGNPDMPLPDHLKDKLLTPVGDNFEWSYGQHDASYLPNGDIILFDNGTYRSKTKENMLNPVEGYSRAVIYRVNTEDKTVEQIWQYGKELGSDYLSTYVSGVQILGDAHYLINFGGIARTAEDKPTYTLMDSFNDGATESVLVELKNDVVVFQSDLQATGMFGNTYRAERHNPYQSTTQPDYSSSATRLGGLPKRNLASTTEMVSDSSLNLFSHTISDNGVQIVYEFTIEGATSEDEAFLLFQTEDTCYQVSLGKGAAHSGAVNHVEIPVGTYDLWIKSGAKSKNLQLSWVNTTISTDPFASMQTMKPVVIESEESFEENLFNDVSSSDWFYSFIEFVTSNNFMAPVTENKFAPNELATRGMVVEAIYSLAGCPEFSSDVIFEDVDTNSSYALAVQWANLNGIAIGTTDTTFSPEAPVTREQLAIMFIQAGKVFRKDLAHTTPSVTFADEANISFWALDAVLQIQKSGLMHGNHVGEFLPHGNTTRAELAVVLQQFHGLPYLVFNTELDMVTISDETVIIASYMDGFEYDFGLLSAWGWCYVPEHETEFQEVYLLVELEDGTQRLFDTTSQLRTDVGIHFEDDRYNHSGFTCNLDGYTLGIDFRGAMFHLIIAVDDSLYGDKKSYHFA